MLDRVALLLYRQPRFEPRPQHEFADALEDLRLGVNIIETQSVAPSMSKPAQDALAAMFLPIALILYNNSLNDKIQLDKELAKMLMICVCMACNIGGFGSPSGGARNVIMMTYLEDMFNINIGYGEWILYGMPFFVVISDQPFSCQRPAWPGEKNRPAP